MKPNLAKLKLRLSHVFGHKLKLFINCLNTNSYTHKLLKWQSSKGLTFEFKVICMWWFTADKNSCLVCLDSCSDQVELFAASPASFSPSHKLLEWDLLSVEQIKRTQLGLISKQFLPDEASHKVLKILLQVLFDLAHVFSYLPSDFKKKNRRWLMLRINISIENIFY